MRYILDDLTLDAEMRRVRRAGEESRLPDLSFSLLEALLKAAPQALSPDDLAREVWQLEHVSADTVAQRVTLLRKSLSDDPKEPRYVRTVRGAGYAAAGPVATETTEHQTVPTQSRPKRLLWPAVAAAMFVMAVMAASNWRFQSAPPVVATDPAPTASAILVARAKEHLQLHRAQETGRAIAMLRQAIDMDPESFDARLALSFALSTEATKFGGGLEEEREAEVLARALIRERPRHSRAYSALGYALGAQGRLRESLSALERAYTLDPTNASALSSAAHTHSLYGEFYDALQLEWRAKSIGGASRYAEIQIASVLDIIGHPAAADWYAFASQMNPGQVVVMTERARSHLRHRDPEGALRVLEDMEGQDSTAPAILHMRARALMVSGRLKEAAGVLDQARDYALPEIMALAAFTGEQNGAEAYLSKKRAHLQDNPDPEARVRLAEVAAALKRDEEAVSLLAQAVNLGWRDGAWLEQSLFLRRLMRGENGQHLLERIGRENASQRRLIEEDPEITSMIASARKKPGAGPAEG
ncbi:MAG: winged helix-turn-helix domain-containing protein [Parvularcula sp.]|jgi:DNA-binding winged helix-turn-helix (wHTH) protein/Flp pilus assembly protein TadD|nr:winged helix-turn-helix domain-containing protein [Parvularcula sp.]